MQGTKLELAENMSHTKGGGKEGYNCEHVEHRVYSYITMYYCIISHTNNCKLTPPTLYIQSKRELSCTELLLLFLFIVVAVSLVIS